MKRAALALLFPSLTVNAECPMDYGIRVCLPAQPAKHVEKTAEGKLVVRDLSAPAPFVAFARDKGQAEADRRRDQEKAR